MNKTRLILLFMLCQFIFFAQAQTTQRIDFADIADKTCFDSPFLLNATATSGLPVKFRIELGKVKLIDNLLVITGPGSVILVAYQEGNATFAPAPEVTKSFLVEIPYDPANLPSLTITGSWCEGSEMTETIQTASGISYRWSTPNNQILLGNTMKIPSVTASNSGIYTLTMYQGNCIFIDIPFNEKVRNRSEVGIIHFPDTLLSNQPPFLVIATPAGGSFTGKNINSTGLYVPNEKSTGYDTIQYTYTNTYGCVSKTSRNTLITKSSTDSTIVIYELISPNGDGKNDYLQIDNIEKYSNYDLIIQDRWGQPLYKTNSYDNKWDGSGLPDGSYFYTLRLHSNQKVYSGAFYITH